MKFRIKSFIPVTARAPVLAVLATAAIVAVNAADKPLFTHPLDNQPIETPLKPGEKESPALKSFKQDGVNPYRGNAEAIKSGKALYDQWCQTCHGADASGKMGPPLVGGQYIYPQTATDAGMFSIIYAGASGAMQPFSKRELTQDEMLKIIAYIRSLDQKK